MAATNKPVLRSLLVGGGLVLSANLALGAEPFATASVHFEQNVTDRDYEVVFEAKGGKEGLAEMTIVAPNGRKVVAFSAPEPATLGIRKFFFESPEPQDLASLKAAYPEGEYLFHGKSFSGATLAGKASLSHQLPSPAVIVTPKPDVQEVAAGKHIAWQPVAGAAAYMVELKTGASKISAKLPASSTSLALPEGFLAAGQKYKLSIGTVGRDGNMSFVESAFTISR